MAIEFPEAAVARKPELRAVLAALEQHAAGEAVTAACHHCGRTLQAETVAVTGTTVVRCPAGDTYYRQVTRPGRVDTAGVPLVTAAEASARGLPAVGISADVAGARMSVACFPAGGMYLSACGPPGAPAAFAVWASALVATDDVAGAVLATVVDRSVTPIAMGEAVRLAIDGVARRAVLFTTGAGFSQTGWVGALVARPAGTVLVALGRVGPMASSVQDLLRDESLAVIARTLRVS